MEPFSEVAIPPHTPACLTTCPIRDDLLRMAFQTIFKQAEEIKELRQDLLMALEGIERTAVEKPETMPVSSPLARPTSPENSVHTKDRPPRISKM
jgi:hypothetical protein